MYRDSLCREKRKSILNLTAKQNYKVMLYCEFITQPQPPNKKKTGSLGMSWRDWSFRLHHKKIIKSAAPEQTVAYSIVRKKIIFSLVNSNAVRAINSPPPKKKSTSIKYLPYAVERKQDYTYSKHQQFSAYLLFPVFSAPTPPPQTTHFSET